MRKTLFTPLIVFVWLIIQFSLFVSPLSAQENIETEFSTYFGGTGTDDCDAVAVDSDGNIYLGCHLNSSVIPGSDEHQYSLNMDMDAFVVKLTPDSSSVAYVSHLGGAGWDAVLDLTVDEMGNVYAVGGTYSTDFPASPQAMQPNFGGVMDAFVTKIDRSGEVIWTTFYGGSGEEEGSSIYLDDSSIVHIAGYTKSNDLVTTSDALQNQYGGDMDAFVASFDSQGKLIYSTYLGGSDEEAGTGIDVDRSGRRYVAGSSNSDNFPIVRGLQTTRLGGSDAFVAVINATGTELVYSSFFGGSGSDGAVGIGVGPTGDAIIAGGTTSSDLAIVSGTQSYHGGRNDVFIAQFNIDRPSLSYSSYLGGSGRERARALLLDKMGMAIIVGQTSSQDFPLTQDFRSGSGTEDDAFIVGIDTANTSLSFSILSGGSGQDNFEGAAIGWDGSLTVSGVTNSADYPLVLPIQSSFLGGRFDIAIARYLLDLHR